MAETTTTTSTTEAPTTTSTTSTEAPTTTTSTTTDKPVTFVQGYWCTTEADVNGNYFYPVMVPSNVDVRYPLTAEPIPDSLAGKGVKFDWNTRSWGVSAEDPLTAAVMTANATIAQQAKSLDDQKALINSLLSQTASLVQNSAPSLSDNNNGSTDSATSGATAAPDAPSAVTRASEASNPSDVSPDSLLDGLTTTTSTSTTADSTTTTTTSEPETTTSTTTELPEASAPDAGDSADLLAGLGSSTTTTSSTTEEPTTTTTTSTEAPTTTTTSTTEEAK